MCPQPLRDSLPEHAILAGGSAAGAWPALLVIDSDPMMLQMLVCYFEKRGFHVAAGTTLADAQTFFHRRKAWTLVLADYHLPDGTGVELCNWIHDQVGPAIPCLLMTGAVHGAALCAGYDYLAKPFPLGDLEVRVRRLLRRSEN